MRVKSHAPAEVTTQRLMFLVLMAAVVLWAYSRARDVVLDDQMIPHWHVYVRWEGGSLTDSTEGTYRPPFWPRYGRHLLGRPWREPPGCNSRDGDGEELCSHDNSDLWMGLFGSALDPPAVIKEAVDRMHERLERARPRTARPKAEILGGSIGPAPSMTRSSLEIPDGQVP